MSDDVDPFMAMAAAAVAFKSLFDAYVAAGFTEQQSLQICISLMTANIARQPSPS